MASVKLVAAIDYRKYRWISLPVPSAAANHGKWHSQRKPSTVQVLESVPGLRAY
jgi:hypothetical protein